HWTMSGPTSVTIDWRGPDATLRYGTTSGYGSSATGVAPSPAPFSSAGPYWEARLSGLTPRATYHYSIAGGPDHVFHTMPAAGDSFTIYVEGDLGDSASYPRMSAVQ